MEDERKPNTKEVIWIKNEKCDRIRKLRICWENYAELEGKVWREKENKGVKELINNNAVFGWKEEKK